MTEQSEHLNVTAPRAKRLSYPKAGNAHLEEVGIKPVFAGHVGLKTLYSGISRGTESLVYKGKVPKSEWSRMRCPYMAGEFGFPVSYGYACVAEVIETGDEVSKLSAGETVFVLHPHQDRITVPAEACIPIPETIPAERAVLAANMETAVNAVWDAQIDADTGQSCAIIGAGVLGLLTAVALRNLTGLEPVIVDINAEKRKATEALGFRFLTPDELAEFAPSGSDFIFHTSTSASGLQTAIDNSAFEGTIVELSWYGGNPISLELGSAFHANRLTIRSSQVGTIAPSHRDVLSFADRLHQALLILQDPRLDVLLEEPIAFQNLPDHVEAIFNSDRLCQVVKYR